MEKWRPVLYIQQPFPDSYIDENFLYNRIESTHVDPLEFSSIISDSLSISQQVSLVSIFLGLFFLHHQEKFSILECYMFNSFLLLGSFLIILTSSSLISSTATLLGKTHNSSGEEVIEKNNRLLPMRISSLILESVKEFFLTVIFVLFLLPVFQTLTVTYSDDTIIALTVLLTLLHLLFTDYSYLNCNSKEKSVQNVIAMNAIVAVAVLLSSRLIRKNSPFSNIKSIEKSISYSVEECAYTPTVFPDRLFLEMASVGSTSKYNDMNSFNLMMQSLNVIINAIFFFLLLPHWRRSSDMKIVFFLSCKLAFDITNRHNIYIYITRD